jgi:DNA-directed RNA polymerase, beta'' subunit/160 kD subunit
LLINGPSTFPGVNYITLPDIVKIRLDFVEDRSLIADSLEIGFLVERHLMDGDIVLFNRQPSLHQISFLPHYVRVLPGKTFRLHPSVFPPYNADFDGDEMILPVPPSEEPPSDPTLLLRVPDPFISPRFGPPLPGFLRDFPPPPSPMTKDGPPLPNPEFAFLATLGPFTGQLPEPENTPIKSLYLKTIILNIPEEISIM